MRVSTHKLMSKDSNKEVSRQQIDEGQHSHPGKQKQQKRGQQTTNRTNKGQHSQAGEQRK